MNQNKILMTLLPILLIRFQFISLNNWKNGQNSSGMISELKIKKLDGLEHIPDVLQELIYMNGFLIMPNPMIDKQEQFVK